MSWKGSPHTSQSILDKKPKKHGHRQLKNRTHCSIQVSFTFSPPLQFWTPVCRLLLRKDPLSLFGFPWFLFLPLSLKCHIFTPSFWGILKFYYDSCFLQKDVFQLPLSSRFWVDLVLGGCECVTVSAEKKFQLLDLQLFVLGEGEASHRVRWRGKDARPHTTEVAQKVHQALLPPPLK